MKSNKYSKKGKEYIEGGNDDKTETETEQIGLSENETSENDIETSQEENIDENNEDNDEEEEEDDDEISTETDYEKKKGNEECIYEYVETKDIDKEEESEEEGVDQIMGDISESESEEEEKYVNPEDRITFPVLYHYEKVRILAARTKQLTLGAKPLVKNTDKMDAKEIAMMELKHNIIPIIIIRPLPNGKKEKWYVRELSH